MPRPSLIAAFALAVLGSACSKAATPTASPAPSVAEPADLVAVLAVASPKAAVASVAAYANAVHAGAGAALTPELLDQALAGLIGAPSLAGCDLDKPLAVVVLDPRQHKVPAVIVGTVADAAKLKAATGVKVVVDGARFVAGPAAEVDAAQAYGLAFLTGRPAPAAPTLTVAPAKLVTRYRAELESFRRTMGQQMAATSPGMVKIVDLELDLFLRLADQTESAQVVLAFDAAEAGLEIALTPRPGSTFEKFDRAQLPGADDHLLAQLPPVDGASMVMVGRYQLGPIRELAMGYALGLFEALAGKTDAQKWGALVDAFTGEMAAVMWSRPDGGLGMQELFAVDDGAKAAARLRELLAPLAEPRTAEIMGFKATWRRGPEVAAHDGVAIDAYAVKPDYAGLPAPQAELLRRMYGESMSMFVAGFDHAFAFTLGAGGAEQMGRLIDTVRRGPKAELAPAVRSALSSAAARKSSLVMFMNLAQSVAAMTGRPGAARSGMAIELSFPDGAARMRVSLPAAHIQELMGAVQGR